MATLFSPMGSEYNLSTKHPQSEVTLKNIASYQTLMEEMRGRWFPFIPRSTVGWYRVETLSPELDLIDSRIVQPSKELVDICKKIRKTIVKREHKLVDYDRHNNSLNKLREKKEKSLSDEKNLFKVSYIASTYVQVAHTEYRSSKTLSLLQTIMSIITVCSRRNYRLS